ncbi:MAG: hypothetical protein R3279_05355 [Putridiphycobacter sp.]|nr:hypothetical protein [Putridiphycobacter sp.]
MKTKKYIKKLEQKLEVLEDDIRFFNEHHERVSLRNDSKKEVKMRAFRIFTLSSIFLLALSILLNTFLK